MTYEEAKMQIQAIPEKIWDQLSEPDREAMEMAFSALQTQEANHSTESSLTRKELDSGNGELATDCINRQAAIDAVYKCTDIYVGNLPIMIDKAEIYKAISELPSSQAEIVRCKNCEHWQALWNFCQRNGGYMFEDDYCSNAERRTDDLQ